MLRKLNNEYFDTQNTKITDSDTITFILRDGYQDGDKLSLSLEGVKYSWQPDSKSLIIHTNEDTNINHIMKNISFEGKGDSERFIEAQYTSKNGEIFNLEEYNVQPMSGKMYNSWHQESPSTEYAEMLSDNIDLGNLLNVIYEENVGVDFIHAQDEVIPYKITVAHEGKIYEILQNSFSNTDSIEIYDYNIKQDKVDINNFIKDFQGAFNYDIASSNNDVQLNVHHDNLDYSIIFKDIAQDLDENLDNLLSTIIFKL